MQELGRFHCYSYEGIKNLFKTMDRVGIALFILLVGTVSASTGIKSLSQAVKDGMGGNPIYRALFLTSALIIFLTTNPKDIRVLSRYKWLWLYIAWWGLSSIWSGMPLATLGKGMEMALGLSMYTVASKGKDALPKTLSLFWISCFFGYCNLILALVGHYLNWSGYEPVNPYMILHSPYMAPNGAGYMSVLHLFLITSVSTKKEFLTTSRLIQVAFFLLCLYLSGSRTSIAILMIGLFWRFGRGPTAVLVSVITAPLMLAALAEAIYSMLHRSGSKLTLTLSGRTVEWEEVIHVVSSSTTKILFGMGGGVGSRLALLKQAWFKNQIVSGADNGFLEVWAGLGVIGLLIWGRVYFAVIIDGIKGMSEKNYLTKLNIVVFYLLGSTIMSLGSGSWFGSYVSIFWGFAGVQELANKLNFQKFNPLAAADHSDIDGLGQQVAWAENKSINGT